eukprot:m.494542 g.494542  ORF g.494542 m.494542 type:complete len:153 (+) comp21796_c1_seq8:190-648(+)
MTQESNVFQDTIKSQMRHWVCFLLHRPQYYDSCMQCMMYQCCRNFMNHDHYELSGMGLEVQRMPPQCCCGICMGHESDMLDMRFLKDIDSFEDRGAFPYCFRMKRGVALEFYEDDGKYKTNKAETVVIYHPYMTNSHYQDMLSVWAELRLVE